MSDNDTCRFGGPADAACYHISACGCKVIPVVPEKHVVCAGCNAWIKDHSWARINAGAEGWFFQKDGTAYCPKHAPEWVSGWRRKRRAPHDRNWARS